MGQRPGPLEGLVVTPEFWRGRRVFVTGHTGFKGGWLSLWLQELGAAVTGLALRPPTEPNLFEVARVGEGMASHVGDILDLATLISVVREAQPEIVFHLAAQSLVRESYRNPVDTYATNVLGTVHLLETVRQIPGIRAVVIVTSDKCYENREWLWGYREDEAMGGRDPYSSSKGCAELVTAAWRQSYFETSRHHEHGVALASARSGNVIGGGDWAADRLVPDLLHAFEHGRPAVIRNPDAVRPWQHVLEPLAGYLLLAEHLVADGPGFAGAWNFGSQGEESRSVQWIAERLGQAWGDGAGWTLDLSEQPHEANCLKLDCSKARTRLGWQTSWPLAETLQQVIAWQQAFISDQDMRKVTLEQIRQFAAAWG